MNQLSSLGLILLFALAAGHLVKLIRVPEVTGYLLAGIALGPSVLGWIAAENLSALEVFSEVALGLILFSLGSVFELNQFRRAGRQQVFIVLIESTMAGVAVAAGMFWAGQQWEVALLLGAIAVETAAASTLMVLRECNARGPFTETITGVFALNNILCLIGFMVVSTAIQLTRNPAGHSAFRVIYASLYTFVWELVGSAALGLLIGFLLSAWSARVVEHGERLILLAGCILLSVGACNALNLSPLIANLTIGATLVNLSNESRQLFKSLSQTDPPLYAIFFVIAGAELNIGLLKTIGVLGVIYVAGRAVGKLLGGTVGGWLASSVRPPYLVGVGLMAQAGLAIGLTGTVHERFPDLAPTVVTVVLAAVMLYEIIGPLGVRWAVEWAGEEGPREPLHGLE